MADTMKSFVEEWEEITDPYTVACIEIGGGGRYWEVINNNTGTIVANIDDHDKAHELAKALSIATYILTEQAHKDKL